MNIIVNYDLLDKITEAKTGFSLNKSSNFILKSVSISTIVDIILSLGFKIDFNTFLKKFPKSTSFYIIINLITELLVLWKYKKIKKDLAIFALINLISCLKDFNIDTSYKMLLDTYKYDSEVVFLDGKVLSKKYFMLPVYDNDLEEISLIQEHIIGSEKYCLSLGKPNKNYKMVFKNSFN